MYAKKGIEMNYADFLLIWHGLFVYGIKKAKEVFERLVRFIKRIHV